MLIHVHPDLKSASYPCIYGVPFVHLIFHTPNGRLCAKRRKMADFLRTIVHRVRGIHLSFSQLSCTRRLCVRIFDSISRIDRLPVCAFFHGLVCAHSYSSSMRVCCFIFADTFQVHVHRVRYTTEEEEILTTKKEKRK